MAEGDPKVLAVNQLQWYQRELKKAEEKNRDYSDKILKQKEEIEKLQNRSKNNLERSLGLCEMEVFDLRDKLKKDLIGAEKFCYREDVFFPEELREERNKLCSGIDEYFSKIRELLKSRKEEIREKGY